MKKILEILTLLAFVTLTLNVWADDYVDDVYYSPQPKDHPALEMTPQTPLKGEVLNDSKAVSQRVSEEKAVSQRVSEEKVSQSTSEVNEDGTITIEYLPQTSDTVVVIRVKK